MAAAATAAAAAAAVGLAVPALAAPAAPSSKSLSAGQTATAAAVPWREVGLGWALATYSAAHEGQGVFKAGSLTLYLVSPQGGRYKVVTWSARSPRARWNMVGWSGDAGRALFGTSPGFVATGSREHVYQLQLRTGHITGFMLPVNVTAVGYTRPDGLNILAEKSTPAGSSITLQRYSLTGKLQKNLATVKGLDTYGNGSGVAYSSNGAQIAAGNATGLELVGNAGGVIRKLPVPGVKEGCSAIRWWSSSTVLASCSVPNEAGPRMWLVPASGARPSALTPVRKGGFDLGDFNAWQLSSGLYVDGLGPCGTLVIGRQPAHGNEHMVSVPGAASSLVVNATRSKLMVERINSCGPGVSLVWFNPKTRAMKVAIAVSRNQAGVSAVVPYFIAGKF
jgi:TolB protein